MRRLLPGGRINASKKSRWNGAVSRSLVGGGLRLPDGCDKLLLDEWRIWHRWTINLIAAMSCDSSVVSEAGSRPHCAVKQALTKPKGSQPLLTGIRFPPRGNVRCKDCNSYAHRQADKPIACLSWGVHFLAMKVASACRSLVALWLLPEFFSQLRLLVQIGPLGCRTSIVCAYVARGQRMQVNSGRQTSPEAVLREPSAGTSGFFLYGEKPYGSSGTGRGICAQRGRALRCGALTLQITDAFLN